MKIIISWYLGGIGWAEAEGCRRTQQIGILISVLALLEFSKAFEGAGGESFYLSIVLRVSIDSMEKEIASLCTQRNSRPRIRLFKRVSNSFYSQPLEYHTATILTLKLISFHPKFRMYVCACC